MSAWDDDDFAPPPPTKNTTAKPVVKDSWDDEDVPTPNLQVKRQWDDEDVPVPESEPVKPKPAEVKKPAAAKAKKAAGKGTSSSNSNYVSTGDPLADKLREQRLVEAADFQNVEDMFGGVAGGREQQPAEEGSGVDLLSSKPRSEIEFETLAKDIVARLQTHEGSFHYPYFVKSLTRQLCNTFTKAEDIKEIISSLNVLVNDRLKSDKPKQAAKKKAPGPTAGKKIFKDAFDDFDTKGSKYDDDDDDFM